LPFAHQSCRDGTGGLNQGGFPGDHNSLGDLTDAQAEVHHRLAVQSEGNGTANAGAKSTQFGLHLIGSRWKLRHPVPTFIIADNSPRLIGPQVGCGDANTREYSVCFILHDPQDGP